MSAHIWAKRRHMSGDGVAQWLIGEEPAHLRSQGGVVVSSTRWVPLRDVGLRRSKRKQHRRKGVGSNLPELATDRTLTGRHILGFPFDTRVVAQTWLPTWPVVQLVPKQVNLYPPPFPPCLRKVAPDISNGRRPARPLLSLFTPARCTFPTLSRSLPLPPLARRHV